MGNLVVDNLVVGNLVELGMNLVVHIQVVVDRFVVECNLVALGKYQVVRNQQLVGLDIRQSFLVGSSYHQLE